MSQRASTSRDCNRRAHPAGHHGRLYIFLVVALAVFLGGIVVWRQPASQSTARLVMQHRQGDEEVSPDELSSLVASDLAIHDVAKQLNLHHSSGAEASIRSRLLVQSHAAPRPGETTVQIWYKDDSADGAKALATALAERLIRSLRQAEQAAAPCNACADEHAQVRRAQADVQTFQTELRAFEAEHAGNYSTTLDGLPLPVQVPAPVITPQVRTDAEVAVEAEPPPVVPAAEPLNPEWVELDDRLQVLRAARDELLTKRTQAHPEVRDLQWQVDELEKQLVLVRRTIARPNESPGNLADNDVEDKVELPPVVAKAEPPAPEVLPAAPAEVVQHYRQLQSQLTDAQQRLELARQLEKDAQQRHQHRLFALAEIVEPARIVSHQGGGVSRNGMMLAGIIAVAVGLLATWRSQAVAQPAELISRHQIEALGIPVVAAISTGDGPALPQPQLLNPAWVRWATFGCELALAAVALAMILLALAEWHIAAGLLRDPLSTFSEAMGRLGS